MIALDVHHRSQPTPEPIQKGDQPTRIFLQESEGEMTQKHQVREVGQS